ncbi:hypothetical protein F2P56_007367 [Juglans regia]|uniref:Reverse transcriptase Ty1/copia-type domain-containing protein n=1 Tax=Juglans regia TaxID=51240 RepID=A0A833Y1E3_JUGRE|nr:hypothetical protein F2P56_007367 [Juglans regia]
MVPFLKGHQLFHHVEGPCDVPLPRIDESENPEYVKWMLTDQIILSALNSSLTEQVLAQVLECSTSREVWTLLHSLFAAQSSAHIMQTQYQLATLKKGSESISSYFNKARTLAASMGAAGQPLSDSEFTVYLLAGLGTDFDSLVTSLTTRADPLSPHQIYSYLLNHESRLAHQTTTLLSANHLTAHVTTTKSSAPSSSTYSPSQRGRGGRNFRGKSGRGRGPSFFSQGRGPLCQVCHKPGHSALNCYFRFDHSYQAAPPSFSANITTTTPPSAHIHSWFPDTAATSHFTPDLTNLNMDSISYQGSDQVSIGDGSTMPIQHIGSANLHTNSGNFLLSQLLHDSHTKVVLLRGIVKDGLYVLDADSVSSSIPFQANIGERTSTDHWHTRLGHPSPRITNLTLRRFQLPDTGPPTGSIPTLPLISPSPINPTSSPSAPYSLQTDPTHSDLHIPANGPSPSSPLLSLNPSPSHSSPLSRAHEPSASFHESGDSAQPASPANPVASTQSLPHSQHPMVTRSKVNVHKPLLRLDGTVPWPSTHQSMSLTTSTHTSVPEEPTSYTEAKKFPEWRLAMQTEFHALLHNHTWDLVPPSASYNVLGPKWILKTKRNADGTLERRKARLVAKGFHQQPGVDYAETFSPVVKPTTIRVILSLAVSSNWSLQQLDIQNAFLHGELEEAVYMQQPTGFVHPEYPSHVCKLRKAIYGLKQAPRAWFSKLSNKLFSLGFQESKSDTSLFVYKNSSHVMFVLIYVDDIIVTGSDSNLISEFITALGTSFPVKHLGKLHYFLGIEICQNSQGLFLSQSKYILDLLQKTNMQNAKPVSTPMSVTTKLSAFDSSSFEDPLTYRSVVGSLQYLSFTRPDISFAVNKVCQYMHNPTNSHWQAVKRILRYLRLTSHLGLFLSKTSPCNISAFSDADWAGCPDDRKSTGGFCVFLGSNLVSWGSKKQPTIARSSTKAEYKAVANTTCEVLWIQSLLRELGIFLQDPPKLWCDNLGATYLTVNPILHARTKHVELDYHFVRDRVAAKTLTVSFLSSKDQLADILTKPLSTARFQFLRSSLTLHPVPLEAREAVKEIGHSQQYSTTQARHSTTPAWTTAEQSKAHCSRTTKAATAEQTTEQQKNILVKGQVS